MDTELLYWNRVYGLCMLLDPVSKAASLEIEFYWNVDNLSLPRLVLYFWFMVLCCAHIDCPN